MNKVILIGRLANEPEAKTTQSGMTVARYRMAVDRQGKKGEADFLNCIAFGKGADFANMFLHKGMKIAIEGRISTGSYTKDDGSKVYTTDIIVERHEFCEGRGATETPAPAAADEYTPVANDEDLPF